MNKEQEQKFSSIISDENSCWHEKATWRIANGFWIRKSQQIALKTIRRLKELSLTYEQGAEKCNIDILEFNKIIRGSENITLENICKIENGLKIEFLKFD